MTEKVVKVRKKYLPSLRRGFPLILKDAIIDENNVKEEGEIIRLVDEQNEFLGKGYYGKQNKGIGWVLSYEQNEQIDSAFFERKLKQALNKRKHFFDQTETTAFRVFNGEGDGIGGLTIDYFAGYYLINWYSKGIYAFQKAVIDALGKLVSWKAIYQKKRFATKGTYIDEDDFVAGERGIFPIIVKENGVHLAVDLNDGAMVGVFLDQREVRKTIKEAYAKGKTVLNTFSYTGVFSVFAALGGAKKTTSVDLAKRSLERTKEQFRINQLNDEAHDILVMDVFHYFKYARKKNLTFDLVILDPPSFARSKKMTFSAVQDYQNLLKEAISVTENEGVIVASTNSSAISMNKLKGFVEKAFKEMKTSYYIVEEFSLPEDFRTKKDFEESNYLKVLFIKKLASFLK